MAEKFKNKYRISSARAQWWDYGNNGAYFVTICTQDRQHYFGKIANAQMILTNAGKIAEMHWHQIPNRFPYAHLGEFIIMPNHIHGIIIIDHSNDSDEQTRLIASLSESFASESFASESPASESPASESPASESPASKPSISPGGITGNKNPMLHKNLSRIIRWYKGRTTFESRKTNPLFQWQPRFYDSIIRDTKGYNRISNYIRNNPSKWPIGKTR